jgi:hypothetical protein
MVSAERTTQTTIRRVGPRRPRGGGSLMGVRDVRDEGLAGLDHNIITGRLEDLVQWARSRSSWPGHLRAWPAAPSR